MKEKPTFKIFYGDYRPRNRRGGWYCYETIVVAETKSVALGLCLEKYPATYAEGWDFEEITLDKHQVIETHREEDY